MRFHIVVAIIIWATFANYHSIGQVFPQEAINTALQGRSATVAPFPAAASPNTSGVYSLMKNTPLTIEAINNRLAAENFSSMTDTIFVGVVPNDTLFITGTFFNNGPVLVFNDGVLIFDHADATLLGDIYVFQDGKMIADSSVINCPQQYFYQRGITIANNGFVSISNTTLDFGGLSHNLAVVQDGSIALTNVTNIGFTTAGAYGNATITIDGTNQAGEFIMTDSSQLSFNNANTILLWHHVPQGGLMNVTFPSGTSVSNYVFDDAQPGVDNIGYHVNVANCTDVMWALMPEGGSDVTITGSTVRAIGLWFTGSDTVAVSGLVNNSNYSAFTAPLSDRNLQLNTTSVQTWSIYLFNSTVMNITGCIVGEVGSMGTSYITAQGLLCDGSGGYYWGSDTSLSIAVNTTVLGYIRSQVNGIVLLGYGSSTSGASATAHSVMVVTQSSLPQDPVAFENGTVWRVHINPPLNLYVDTVIDITGSAFIDQGPLGSFMDFGSFTTEYAPQATPGWITVSSGNPNEVHNGLLSQWDTHGLTPGSYLLRLNTLNNSGDSIDAVIQVTLLPSILGTDEQIDNKIFHYFYNQLNELITVNYKSDSEDQIVIEIVSGDGKKMYQSQQVCHAGDNRFLIPAKECAPGLLHLGLYSKQSDFHGKIIITK